MGEMVPLGAAPRTEGVCTHDMVRCQGMHWGDLLPLIWPLFCRHRTSHGLVMQLGETDITSLWGINLKKDMEASLQVIQRSYPGVTLFWSQLLQMRCWQGARHPGKIEMIRQKLDKAIGCLVIGWGGHWIKHPEITFMAQDMYWADG
ncbi:hypothetical protein JRQ81_002652, partial [Phrynocephalus forsythii]